MNDYYMANDFFLSEIQVSVGLRQHSAFVDPQKSNALVNINVIDVNDNTPR